MCLSTTTGLWSDCSTILQAILVADLVVLLESGRVTYCGKASGLQSSFLDNEFPENERTLSNTQTQFLPQSDSPLIKTLEGTLSSFINILVESARVIFRQR